MMIRVKNFFSAVLLVTILVSCNTGKNKNGTVSSSGSDKPDTEDANKIIAYTNDVIDVLKKYNEAVEEAVENYEDVENKMNQKEDNIFLRSGVKFSILGIENQKAAVAFGSPTSALGSNRVFFADSLAKYKRLFDQFRSQQSTVDLYLKGKDYLDDNYAKGKEWIQKQYSIYKQMAILKSAINDKIEILADEAEEIALKDDPMRDAFIAAKQDLKKAKNVAYIIDGIDDFTDNDIKAIDSLYNDLVESIEAHKNIDRTELVKGKKNDAYTRFYGFLTEGVTEIKAFIRQIKQDKKLANSDYENINRIIKNIIDQYNYWVG
jgi:hypothetical protein